MQKVPICLFINHPLNPMATGALSSEIMSSFRSLLVMMANRKPLRLLRSMDLREIGETAVVLVTAAAAEVAAGVLLAVKLAT